MSATDVVRARIDPKIKSEAAAVLDAMGLSVSDAFRMLLTRVAREKALPFEPLVPKRPNHRGHAGGEAGRPQVVQDRRGAHERPRCGRLSVPHNLSATISGLQRGRGEM